MRRYGVFIPESSSFNGFNRPVSPSAQEPKGVGTLLCALADNLNRIHLVLKNWPVMKYLKQESVSLRRTLN